MSETLKNLPKCEKCEVFTSLETKTSTARAIFCEGLRAVGKCPKDEWFEGFETKMHSFRDSSVQCIEWLQKYTMIDPLDTMKLMQVQAALRTFIEKEILGE